MTSVHVATPSAFTATLRDADPYARRAALAALATHDPGAVALARGEAETVLGILSDAFDPSVATPYDRAVLAALDALDIATAAPLVGLVFEETDDPEVRMAATDMLARWGDPGGLLQATLARYDRPDLRSLAARHLPLATLPARTRLAAALARIEHGADPADVAPHPGEEGLRDAYLDALQGPDPTLARRAAEAHGAAGFATLAGAPVEHPPTRTWLVGWAARVRSVAALAYLEARLDVAAAAPPCSGSGGGVPYPDQLERDAAIGAVRALGVLAEPLRPAVRRWADALRACAPNDPRLADLDALAVGAAAREAAGVPSLGTGA